MMMIEEEEEDDSITDSFIIIQRIPYTTPWMYRRMFKEDKRTQIKE